MIANNLYKEKYRLQYHFSPKKNWSNDPNGMVYYQGEYHLFYQYNPADVVWGPMHWGHAVSKDLIHWEHLPVALEPDAELGMIFSGSAVLDKNDTTGFFDGGEGLVAVYTTHLEREEGPLQQQAIAYSKDSGRSWIKYEGNPVIKNYGVKDFRDPKVFWHQKTEKWVMIVACYDRVRFYNSPDLKKWEYLSEFGSELGSHGGVWECPDLFKLPVEKKNGIGASNNEKEKWILQIGDQQGGEAGVSTQYFIGEFDGTRFKANEQKSHKVDFGQDLYALQSWSNMPDQRRVWLGWMNNIAYAEDIPTDGWKGMMSIPRELSLRKTEAGLRLIQKPVKELKQLRERFYHQENVLLKDNFSIPCNLQSYQLTVELEISDESNFNLALHKKDEQQSQLNYEGKTNTFTLDLSKTGLVNFNKNYLKQKKINRISSSNNLILDILVDQSSIEIFIDDGEISITDLVFPEKNPDEIKLTVNKSEIKINSLNVFEINSIW
ncbi:levanase [Halanaerobium saccharolyticum]|uniref:Levanase n=1 Tax=Halanaerobium saccharolyticum TaxID=43595 RepID=A0A4R7YKG4_9FIRM|nr:glycoside hydrolase family 32 protein [Halanaerobium saccharolyticum]RAK03951.1 levanase [Halanaerobium saccharolyticum]TDV97109.1 levanase [Halanaerobium saccharolyticum]TDX49041.1 levanase [Halanaerobium saccharolyticum]